MRSHVTKHVTSFFTDGAKCILLSREISRRMPSESCLGTPWGPSYEHIYKNIHFCKGKGRERKKGSEGKKGREGKRKGKRKKEREGKKRRE